MNVLSRWNKLTSVIAPAAWVETWWKHGREEAWREFSLSLRVRPKGLPRRWIEDLVDVQNLKIQFAAPGRHASQGVADMACLASIVAAHQPRKILEIGTFRGATAHLFALNAPEATVYTLDLPTDATSSLPSTDVDEYVARSPRDRMVFEGTAEQTRIIALKGDSATFDFDAVGPDVDLAFIDGAHSYDYVKNDTQKVLSRIRPGGVVIWDDYSDLFPGVVRYLNEIPSPGLTAVMGTRLVVGKVSKSGLHRFENLAKGV